MREIKFAHNLKQVRTSKNLRQCDLAEMIGVANNTISSYEKDKYPLLETLAEMCLKLNTPADYLIFDYRTVDEKLLNEISEMGIKKKTKILELLVSLNKNK